MTPSMILGFLGDSLTFGGGILLSWDALQRGSEFKKIKGLQTVVAKFAGIDIRSGGIKIFDDNSTELLFIRKSVRRAKWGTVIITCGFLCLLASRITEVLKL
jgi:hypothetical protein